VKQQLAEVDLVPEEWDGSTMVVPVAALEGEGIEDLLEAILLVSDESEIVANPQAEPAGVVLEAEVDHSRGVITTLLVLNGTLKRGETIIAGNAHGRIKAMFDETGQQLKAAGPSTPVAVMGLSDLPEPGDSFETVKSDKVARAIIEERQAVAAEAASGGPARPAVTLQDVFAQFEAGETKELNLILRVDVQGTMQPIIDSLNTIAESNKGGIGINILSSGIGDVSENDIMLANASSAIIIAFNVNVDGAAKRSAASQNVDIRQYNVIYKLLEDIELALLGMLEPEYGERVIGTAEVRQVFRISRVGAVAGSYVLDGEIRRNAKVRVRRGRDVIAENLSVSSLKRVSDDVREVRAGFECGIALDGFNDFEEGDQLEFFVTERIT
jgi:translation initiation factor IF-2